ncbi:alpha/beta fold hydrolase [Geminocystis sp. NIES-3709]|uniref:alpha/beta fold hydrolase n=1 Tax=Geminocystis sp. NIES-3709 TaxID=1617448 RepID=UPI0005FCCA35|nr:alpha/beta hydrolase [Geminocystis sp. NIES-3709]BAQ63506.1 hypothetical protein GM3709_271 [Geminocystis sp. NIES-3709]
MFKNPDVLWLNTNPYLLRFNLPIIKYLSRHVNICQWEYSQTEDEGTSLDIAIELLDDYISLLKKPVNLIGHSTCGLLGLLYAQKYPEKVKSLTILGVGINPSLDWLSYYYLLRTNLYFSKERILSRLANILFGYHNYYYQKAFIGLLEKALLYSLSPHSLYKRFNLSIEKISSPLMICGSENDQIVSWEEITKWKNYLKPQDILWQCPEGEHFFHYFQPSLVSENIINFLMSQVNTQPQLKEKELIINN